MVRNIAKTTRPVRRPWRLVQWRRLKRYGVAMGAVGLIATSVLGHQWRVQVSALSLHPYQQSTTSASANPRGVASSRQVPGAANAAKSVIRVLLIGGSAAHGWQDPRHNSYLKRAFVTVEDSTGRSFQLFDHTIPGGTAAGLPRVHYQQWLNTGHPNIVVLSWGLLNDVHRHTPLFAFNAAMRDEITLARKANAVVLLVTPPVTKASATNGWPLERTYLRNEIRDAQVLSIRDPHVQVIDLFRQMKSALHARGETFVPYAADWAHPNAAGHRLAGELLAAALLQRKTLHFSTLYCPPS